MADEAEAAAPKPLEQFHERCKAVFFELFDKAKQLDEVQYAMSLSPEFRCSQDAGWNTAREASRAYEDYIELLRIIPPGAPARVRVALALYSHVAESSGLYEVPKCMMHVASGEGFGLLPFNPLVSQHAVTGENIAPNATKVMKDLIGHARSLGLTGLEDIILETFDFDIRNGYAHADYVIWDDGIRLPKRNGGTPKIVAYPEFTLRLNKSISFIGALTDSIAEAMQAYHTPKRTLGRPNSQQPVMPAIISYTEDEFRIQIGFGL